MGRRPISVGENKSRERFGTMLKQHRTSLGLGLHEAARASGLNHTTLSRIENGERPIGLGDLRGLADAYGVPWEALVMAQRGQLPLALAAATAERPDRGRGRLERLAKRITAEEKQQLVLFLGYLRFTRRFEGPANVDNDPAAVPPD